MKATPLAPAQGHLEEEIARYRIALDGLSDRGSRHRVLLGLAGALCDGGRLDEAVAICEQAVEASPESHAGYAMLASILLDLGRLEAAANAGEAALVRAPHDIHMLNLATGIALRRGRAEEALRLADASLIVAPCNPRALSHLAIASAQLGRQEQLQRLLDFDRLLKVAMASPPPGFSSIESFNRALIEALLRRTDLGRHHVARTLVGGARLEDSFVLDPPIAEGLRHIFAEVAAEYIASLKVDPDHPVRTGQPTHFAIASWTNLMDSAAFELPHMHEGAWLSGVYYPEMPPVQIDSLTVSGGAIEFGGHDFGDALPTSGPTRTVMPIAGMVVVFPSYFYHRTIQFEGAGRRISVAFDINPRSKEH
jgi:tetratricopeptide (TPR) repeat protein